MCLVFVITVCIRNDVQLRQLEHCIKSIRRFHTERIFLLDETEEETFIETIKHQFTCFENENIIIHKSPKKGLGELQVFQFILDCLEICEDDNVVFLHDSTVIFQSIQETVHIKDLQFIWYFTSHRIYWDNIVEEQTPYNIENGIISHTDCIVDCLKKHYYQNPFFLVWALDALKNKEKWVGCFGYMCIIKKKELFRMNQVVPFTHTFLTFSGRRHRIMNESVFSLICNYFYSHQQCIQSLDGLYFDGNYGSIRGKDLPVEENKDALIWCIKGDYIGKISFAR